MLMSYLLDVKGHSLVSLTWTKLAGWICSSTYLTISAFHFKQKIGKGEEAAVRSKETR